MPIFTDTETSKMGMIYIADRQIRVATHMGRVPPWFDPDDPEKEKLVKAACRATKERHAEYMSLYKDYPEELPPVPSNPFILDPDLKKCLTEEEYEYWQLSYMKRYPRKCDIWEGYQNEPFCKKEFYFWDGSRESTVRSLTICFSLSFPKIQCMTCPKKFGTQRSGKRQVAGRSIGG